MDSSLSVAQTSALTAPAAAVDCPVCRGALTLWRTKATAYGRFRIDRCRGCGFAFVNPKPSVDYLVSFYQHGSDGHEGAAAPTLAGVLAAERAFPNSTVDARRLMDGVGRVLRPAPPGSRPSLLDVGAGYGFFSREAADRGFDVTALELDEKSRAVFRDLLGFDAVPVFFEAYEPQGRTFDVIVMSHVLEHVIDPARWIARARGLLRDGGVLALALPNFSSIFRVLLQDRDPYVTPPAHLNYFDARNLSALLRKNGFEVQATDWVSRIPPGALRRRLPGPVRPLAGPMEAALAAACVLIDRTGRGQAMSLIARAVA